jgi:queuine tRNA-ribosyltransferase
VQKQSIETKHGKIQLPAFMPDATYGSIRTASFKDVKDSGINEIVTTTLHLEQKIGSKYIKKLGGLHKFFNWDRPILTDSGGWQVFSLINSSKGNKNNKVTELGCSFINPESGDYSLLTPEASITIQSNLGADIFTVLDDPIIGDASLDERKKSVRYTTNWAKRAKEKFTELYNLEESSKLGIDRPLLGAVIQGADDLDMRKQSAEELLDLDLDLYNFGGIPLYGGLSWRNWDEKGRFYREMLHYVGELIPEEKYKYAMGIGQPDDIAYCVEIGWDLFDTVLPTRNARHGYLYVSKGMGNKTKGYKHYEYDIMNVRSERYKFDQNPIDENCNCECCSTVSRAYLRHLIRIGEPAGQRLATIHNLHFYAKWMEMLREEKFGKN